MVRIAPRSATAGLVVGGAAEILPRGSPFYLYGPYRRSGVHTAASNEAFDRSLRDRDPGWGIRVNPTHIAPLGGVLGTSLTALRSHLIFLLHIFLSTCIFSDEPVEG